jgi:hypothetical protein
MTAMEIAKKYHTTKGASRISDIRRDPDFKNLTVLDMWVKRGKVKYKKYWAVAKAKRAK